MAGNLPYDPDAYLSNEVGTEQALRFAHTTNNFLRTQLAEAQSRFKAPIVCMCGSTRFKQTWIAENARLAKKSNIVLSVGLWGHHERVPLDEATKARLDDLHKRKIDLCDWVWVLDVGGYIGESTRSEIVYAEKIGKPVRYLNAEMPDYVEPADPLVEAQAALGVSRAIGDTFWAALKPLGLQAINVMNPGQHVTDLITQLEAERTAREAAERQSHSLARGLTVANQRIATLGRERDEAINDAVHVHGLRCQIADLQKKLDEAKCLLSHRVEADRLSEANQRIEYQTERADNAESCLEHRVKQVQHFQRDLTAANQRIAELESEIGSSKDEAKTALEQVRQTRDGWERAYLRAETDQQATIERLQGFVEDIAECDCSYGDNCPTFGANHYRCESCKARSILAATPQPEQPAQEVPPRDAVIHIEATKDEIREALREGFQQSVPEPDTRKWGICLPDGSRVAEICEDTEDAAWKLLLCTSNPKADGYYAVRVDDEKEASE